MKTYRFYKEYISGEILKIERTRGTKVYYTESDFFYLDTYKGVVLKQGNTFQKNGPELIIFEKDKNDIKIRCTNFKNTKNSNYLIVE